LALPEGLVDNLITIDPISVQNCSSSSWIASTTGSALGIGPSEGCTNAPQDLAPQYGSLQARVQYWLNAWQDEFRILHSSNIAAAHENLYLTFSEWSWHLMGAHYQAQTSEKVWSRASQLFKK
jgi:hypothetical protein